MNLRAYKPSDLQTLFEIDRSCFPPGISYSSRELSRFINHAKSKTWIAENVGSIVGFLIASQEPKKVGHIITIDVVETGRRSGVGTALMDEAEEWGRRAGLKLIYLETAEENRTAQIFYTARGYAKVEEIPDYYMKGKTAWVMVKWLK
jgi:[ribosomal protein S18]-alanine N-acetyltransferase